MNHDNGLIKVNFQGTRPGRSRTGRSRVNNKKGKALFFASTQKGQALSSAFVDSSTLVRGNLYDSSRKVALPLSSRIRERSKQIVLI
jgi:hypothetical protein